MKKVLRIISGIMLIVAILFLIYAMMHPEGGSVFYIFGVPIGSGIWRAFYAVYVTVMIGLFVASFFVKRKVQGG
jgi:hypothetical protein